MSCDEEQVCLMIKQVQVKAISDGGYGPFSNNYGTCSVYQAFDDPKIKWVTIKQNSWTLVHK